MEDFIGVYDNIISSNECKQIIRWFESCNKFQIEGQCSNEVHKNVKDSTDIPCFMSEEFSHSKIIYNAIAASFEKYKTKYSFLDKLDKFSLDPGYNIQRYFPNQGYFAEHCEHSGTDPDDIKRILAWTIYLNDVSPPGGTLFTMLNKEIQSKEGRVVIFPAYWTHAHKGVVSKSETKYIITGWFSFL